MENNLEENLTKQSNTIGDLGYKFKLRLRLFRKKITELIRKQLKKDFAVVLYVTVEEPPTDFILSLQKQYPDKMVKVLKPIFEITKDMEKTSISVDYYLQNKKRNATIYKLASGCSHVEIFGAYTSMFSKIQKTSDIYNIRYLSHFVKIARKTALKMKPDVVHAENIPFFMGLEAGNRWTSGYPIKVVQTVHDNTMYPPLEPFWAIINLVNKKEIERIYQDKFIVNNLAMVFNLEKDKKNKKLRACLNYLYNHYDNYRKKVDVTEQTKENVLLKRLNDRIKKIFPNFVHKNHDFYNPMYYSLKRANIRVFNSMPENSKNIEDMVGEFRCLHNKYEQNNVYKIHYKYDLTNYREVRPLNKKFLVRELSEKRIETRFIDMNLFEDDEINICGYLDSFYRAPLFFVMFNEYTKEDDMKNVSAAIIKAFELRKNLQVIYNFPKNLQNTYLDSLFEFFQSQQALNGRWAAIEGKLSVGQFMSSADMMLFPSGKSFGVEKTLYTALKYGCVPIVSNSGICSDIVTDILDDMTNGCGFKNNNGTGDEIKDFEAIFIRALDFYANNSSSWNVLIKNAMSYNSGWDFESIEKYNNLYDDVI